MPSASVGISSPNPSPEQEMRSLFLKHCSAMGAPAAAVTDFSELAPEFIEFINELGADDDDDDCGGLAISEPRLRVDPIGFVPRDDGTIFACVFLTNEDDQYTLVNAIEDIPIVLPQGSVGAMICEFQLLPNSSEDAPFAERYRVSLGHMLTEASHQSERARILNHDLDGFYGRKLCALVEGNHHGLVEAGSIISAEFAAPLEGIQVIRFEDTLKNIYFAELGKLGGTELHLVRSIQRFPKFGTSLEENLCSLQSEALVGDFSTFQTSDDLSFEILEGEQVADDYLPILEDHLRENYFLNWDSSWKVAATTAVFSSAAKGFWLFARVVDARGQSVLPIADGSSSAEPLYSGFALSVLEERGKNEGESEIELVTFGFVLTQKYLHQDFEVMSSKPEKSLLSYLMYDVVGEDLVRRRILTGEEGDRLQLHQLRVSYFARHENRDIYAVHVTHSLGEHVIFLFRHVPSGLIRTGPTGREQDESEIDTDFGIRYFMPLQAASEVEGELPERPSRVE